MTVLCPLGPVNTQNDISPNIHRINIGCYIPYEVRRTTLNASQQLIEVPCYRCLKLLEHPQWLTANALLLQRHRTLGKFCRDLEQLAIDEHVSLAVMYAAPLGPPGRHKTLNYQYHLYYDNLATNFNTHLAL